MAILEEAFRAQETAARKLGRPTTEEALLSRFPRLQSTQTQDEEQAAHEEALQTANRAREERERFLAAAREFSPQQAFARVAAEAQLQASP